MIIVAIVLTVVSVIILAIAVILIITTILMVNPNESGTRLVSQKEWNLTDSLPQVSANMGIEAVEWVANADVSGKLIDKTTGKPFDAAN